MKAGRDLKGTSRGLKVRNPTAAKSKGGQLRRRQSNPSVDANDADGAAAPAPARQR